MSTVRNADHVTGWSAVGVLATIAITRALTALVMSFPLAWLTNHVFSGGVAMNTASGSDRLSYWRCVGLFAIWFTARVKIKFSAPALIEIEGDR